MAIKMVEIAGTPSSSRRMTYMIDSDADVAELPTTTKKCALCGKTVDEMSVAVTNDGRIFVLGNDDVWHEW